MALSGIEVAKDSAGRPREVAQTWMCSLHVSENAAGYRVRQLYSGGVAVPKRAARDRGGSHGLLLVGDDYSNVLQRHTACAELRSHQISTFPADRLIDCHIEWMSEESFELGGLHLRPACHDSPEQLERGGWLVDIDIRQRELAKEEARMLR